MERTHADNGTDAAGLLDLGARRIEYRWCTPAGGGSGPDLVLLHEGLGCVAMWKDFPERLAAATGARVMAYSRHGYGGSSALSGPRAADYLHEEALVWLPRVLAALGIDRPVLLGHSDGATIGLIHAALPLANACGLIVMAPHVMLEPITRAGLAAAREAYASGSLKRGLARYHADVDSAFHGWNDAWLDAAFRDFDIRALLPSIRVPVLAIQGVDDEYGTLDQIDCIARAVPQGERLALERCGHSPQRDQPDRLIEAIRRLHARCRATG
jgi:pimeloyl-ACP methyl ester carboxylesterase